MLPISPTELAQLLQLSSGADGTASIVGDNSLKEAIQRVSSLVFLKDAPRRPQESYTEEFWSQYLPSFLRSMLAGGDTQGVCFLRLFQWMSAASRTSLDRFVREHPQEACEVYLFEAHMLAVQVERNNTLLVNEEGVKDLIRSTMHFINSLIDLIPQLPTTVPMPCLPTRSKAGVLAVASVFKQDPRFARSVVWTRDQCREAIQMLLLLASVSDVRDQESAWSRKTDSSTGRWWACELGRQATAPGECTKMEEGEQMQACSRCIGVRYCSKDHQRADWKRHKLVCFKPSW